MLEHDWHTLPAAGCAGIYCLRCDVVYDCDDKLYFRKDEYDKPGIPDDPGCVEASP
jgi:hypothetical protein